MINYLLATQRVESTFGMTLNRLFRYLKFSGAYLISTALAAGTGFAGGAYFKSSGAAGLIGAAIGFGLCAYFIYWSRRGRLYQFWAPHLSLFGKLAEDKSIATGKQQLEVGVQQVQRLFDIPADLAGFHDQAASVLRELFIKKLKFEQIAALPLVGAWLKIDFSLFINPLRDALMALSFGEDIKNPWQTMQNNLALVAKHIGSIQFSLLMVLAMQVISCVLAFVVWYVGVDWLADHWPDVDMSGWKILITGLLTWIMYAAFIYPIAVNAMLDEFLKIQSKDQAEITISEQLSGLSAFTDISGQAQTYVLPAERPEPQPAIDEMKEEDNDIYHE
jgi:hypothetical protein